MNLPMNTNLEHNKKFKIKHIRICRIMKMMQNRKDCWKKLMNMLDKKMKESNVNRKSRRGYKGSKRNKRE